MLDKQVADTDKLDASEEAVEKGTAEAEETAQAQVADDANQEEGQSVAIPDEWKQKYDELISKYEKDIGNVKSALQRNLSESEKSFAEKERSLLKQIDDLRKSTMNDDERAKYEQSLAYEELGKLRQDLESQKAETERVRNYFYYLNFFKENFGVQEKDLKTDGSVQELFQSGMEALANRFKELSEQPTADKPKPKEGKKPPSVAQPSSAPASSVLSLLDLAKKYGNNSIDELYRKAERDPNLATLITEAARKQTQ